MSHFRKMLFAAAAVASFLGMSNSANAQSNPFVCNTSFSPLVVRVEGLRELVGDIVISCSGGNSIGTGGVGGVAASGPANTPPVLNGVFAHPYVGGVEVATPTVPAINISVTVAGTRITNRIFGSGNLTDALLFIDDPTTPTSGSTRLNQNPCDTDTGTPGVCTGLNYFFENGVATGAGRPVSGASGNPLNVFQAQYGIGGGYAPNEQTITFVGVPVVQPGSFVGAGTRTFRIKNIRVQVANSFQVNGQIQAFIGIQNPPANLVLNNAQGVVGFVQRGLFFDTVAGGPYAQCLGFNVNSSGSFAGHNTSTALQHTGLLRFTEAYGVSFKRRGFDGALDKYDAVYNQYYIAGAGQANPTANYNNESGFYNRNFPETNGLRESGIASQGTRLRARFVGIPASVRLYVSAQPLTGVLLKGAYNNDTVYGQGVDAVSAAFAVNASSPNGEGTGFTANTSYAFGGTYFTGSTPVPVVTTDTTYAVQGSDAPGFGANGAAYGTLPKTPRFNQVTIASDGTGVFFWEVLRANDNTIDRFDFVVAAAFAPTTSIVTDANTSVAAQVSGNYAPIGTTGGNGYPSIPLFVLSSPEDLKPIFTITNCATNLLYPFVSSVTGFNTGVAVSNTSKDPFGTVNETGICKVFFYGTTAGGGVDPTPQSFSKSVPSGQTATFNLLYGGPDYGIQPVVGFQGYIIISCNFRYAHGFAFISDPSNLQTAHGYLALILDPKNKDDIWRQRQTGVLAAESLDN